MTKFHIKKISEIDKNKLLKFYQASFKYEKSILDDFAWRYRSGFNNFEPLVLIINNKICGHAGLISVDLKVEDKIEKAIWFTDFYVDSKYRTLGYGKLLTEAWMKICPIQITLCNDQSLKIFKKFSWSYNNNFIRKIKFYNFINILPAFRKLDNSENFTDKLGNLRLEELNNKTISKIIKINEENFSQKSIGIVRDESWFKWRISDCPYKKDILIFSYENTYLITHVKKRNNLKILNIIYSSKDINSNLIKVFLDFSKRNHIDYLSYISKKNKLIDLCLPWERKLNFAFYSDNQQTFKKIKENFSDIQYIDSDIDYI
ncbi:GNAT family N-acetyltransferase [Pelagibacterales bacterium SAG-MED05]|nr:GNAT family N-acetyltransferase [Pelagibacterales bacterium SAG-MED05]